MAIDPVRSDDREDESLRRLATIMGVGMLAVSRVFAPAGEAVLFWIGLLFVIAGMVGFYKPPSS